MSNIEQSEPIQNDPAQLDIETEIMQNEVLQPESVPDVVQNEVLQPDVVPDVVQNEVLQPDVVQSVPDVVQNEVLQPESVPDVVQSIKMVQSPSGVYTLSSDVSVKPRRITIQPGGHVVGATAISSKMYFFVQVGIEWVCFNTSHYSQQYINLETGESYNNEGPGMSRNFCWTNVKISPDGMTAAVSGCYWGANYEILFFDLSNLSRGVPEIPIADLDSDFILFDGYAAEEFEWLDATTLEYRSQTFWSNKYNKLVDDLTSEELDDEDSDDDTTALLFKVHLRREEGDGQIKSPGGTQIPLGQIKSPGGTQIPLGKTGLDEKGEGPRMVYVLKESTPTYDQKLMESKTYQARRDRFDVEFKTNTRYLELKTAFPEANIFLFYHNGSHQDLESDIQDVHFGAWIGNVELKSYKDRTCIRKQEFPTMTEALASIVVPAMN